jgi:TfoX/Sxy family transcriptional regulator of competence genes
MAYDEGLADRIRDVVDAGTTERKMFGGIAFMQRGNMFVGIVKDDLMVRVGPDRNDEALRQAHARPMDFTGKPMKGYVFVAPAGYESDDALEKWVNWGAEFVATLPAKVPKPKAKSARRR